MSVKVNGAIVSGENHEEADVLKARGHSTGRWLQTQACRDEIVT